MKVALAVLFLSVSAVAQTKATGAADACGPRDVVFDVKTDNSQHTLAQPEAGKALVYIIDKSGLACTSGGWCVMRAGLDGTWVGAYKGSAYGPPYNSYVAVPIEPGEHHVCVDGQSGAGDMIALAHFTAEAGKVYYLGIEGVYSRPSRFLNIGPLDSDEGKYLIATRSEEH